MKKPFDSQFKIFNQICIHSPLAMRNAIGKEYLEFKGTDKQESSEFGYEENRHSQC